MRIAKSSSSKPRPVNSSSIPSSSKKCLRNIAPQKKYGRSDISGAVYHISNSPSLFNAFTLANVTVCYLTLSRNCSTTLDSCLHSAFWRITMFPVAAFRPILIGIEGFENSTLGRPIRGIYVILEFVRKHSTRLMHMFFVFVSFASSTIIISSAHLIDNKVFQSKLSRLYVVITIETVTYHRPYILVPSIAAYHIPGRSISHNHDHYPHVSYFSILVHNSLQPNFLS